LKFTSRPSLRSKRFEKLVYIEFDTLKNIFRAAFFARIQNEFQALKASTKETNRARLNVTQTHYASNDALNLLFLLLGPFRVMMSSPAGLEEVIKYADFKKEATVEDVDDDSTLEDEPDEEDLEDMISGNITLNASRIIVLPDGELVRFPYSFPFSFFFYFSS